ncbi:hypothetical protein BCL76_101737 [Streptomyces sp. CG 926]|nr:hypothetical protein BCL76_101737 [Streptomyces sp. CG 926]
MGPPGRRRPGSMVPAGLNVFNSSFAPFPSADSPRSYSQVPKRRMYQVFTSWVSVQYASSTPISHGK